MDNFDLRVRNITELVDDMLLSQQLVLSDLRRPGQLTI
jgi:hypothetical protein